MLFAPEERLGWAFTDRAQLRQPFDEAAPADDGLQHVTAYEIAVRAKLPARLVAAWKAAAAGAVVAFSWLLRLMRTRGHVVPATAGKLVVACAVLAGLLWCLMWLGHWWLVRRFWGWRRRRHLEFVIEQTAAWSQRRSDFEEVEGRRLAAVPQWGSVPVAPGVQRIDVIGGSLWGWEALLTVFGASALTARGPLLVLDLSSQMIARELVAGTAALGRGVDVQLLPLDLAESDLLVGLGPAEVAEVFVESLHGGDAFSDRLVRAVDSRLLTAVCDVLAPGGLSMERIAAGARALLGEPVTDEALTASERRILADEVFSGMYLSGSAESLRRIEAMAYPIGALGRHREPRPPADVRCVAASTLWRSAGEDFLGDLVIAWAARQVAAVPSSVATLVVAGADDIAVRHIERLSDLCERRGVRLVLMFRHLRNNSAQVLGSGPVVFMRLGNSEEAAHAADFIGREHRFELSQVTYSVGGDETHSATASAGASEGSGRITGRERGVDRSGLPGAATHHWSSSDSRSWNVERNWGQSLSTAASVSWSTTASSSRTLEYTVEPRALQQLPDYAMIVVDHSPIGVQVQAVEINPVIPLLLAADSWPSAKMSAASGAALDPGHGGHALLVADGHGPRGALSAPGAADVGRRWRRR